MVRSITLVSHHFSVLAPRSCDNTWRKQFKEGRVSLGSQFEGTQSIMATESGHIVNTVRKQKEMNAGLRSLSPFYYVSGPSQWGGAAHI